MFWPRKFALRAFSGHRGFGACWTAGHPSKRTVRRGRTCFTMFARDVFLDYFFIVDTLRIGPPRGGLDRRDDASAKGVLEL